MKHELSSTTSPLHPLFLFFHCFVCVSHGVPCSQHTLLVRSRLLSCDVSLPCFCPFISFQFLCQTRTLFHCLNPLYAHTAAPFEPSSFSIDFLQLLF
eukprot:m.16945 g.16945  ORF g.16945 m.16945 type:complete len:97 (+) comp7278_c0_seq2:2447-2737(+)